MPPGSDTPPPAAVPVDPLVEDLRSQCYWYGYAWHSAQPCATAVCRGAREIESLRAALAAAERERDDAAKVIADLRFNQGMPCDFVAPPAGVGGYAGWLCQACMRPVEESAERGEARP